MPKHGKIARRLPRRTTATERQLRKARSRMVIVRNNGKPPEGYITPKYKKKDFIRALAGTGGIKKLIAEKLGCTRPTVTALLSRPDWQDVLEAYNDEVEAGIDDAKRTIREAITQRFDMSTAANTAKWYLSKIERDVFGDRATMEIEGGKRPLQVNTLNANIPVETLGLPVEVRRTILDAIEARDVAAAEEKDGKRAAG